jgi:hypothetical protein
MEDLAPGARVREQPQEYEEEGRADDPRSTASRERGTEDDAEHGERRGQRIGQRRAQERADSDGRELSSGVMGGQIRESNDEVDRGERADEAPHGRGPLTRGGGSEPREEAARHLPTLQRACVVRATGTVSPAR